MTGFVYFLRCGDYVKIGYSRTPDVRVAMLKCATPYKVEQIAVFPGTRAHEQATHKVLASVHHVREWFRWGPEVQQLIAEGLPHPDVDAEHFRRPAEMPENRMLHIRKDFLKLTQSEMAVVTGVSQATVSRWETGELEPSRSELARIRDEAMRRNLSWNDSLFFAPTAQSNEAVAP